MTRQLRHFVIVTAYSTVLIGALSAQPVRQSGTVAKHPMSFLDMQNMRTASAPAISPDGRWALYTISTPDWKADRRQSDIYLVGTREGLASNRQLTFTKDK